MSASSSTSQARTEPPSESRAHEARRQGHAPRAEFAGLAAAFVTFTLWIVGSAPTLERALQSCLAVPLRAAAAGKPVDLGAHAQVTLASFGASIAALLALCLATMIAARSLAQGAFHFSLQALSPSRSFDKIASTRWLSALFAVLLCSVVIFASAFDLLRSERSAVQALLRTLSLRLSAALVAIALVDASLARAAFWRSLWMTRRERQMEDREAYGSPETRAARDRTRRATHTDVQQGTS